MNWTVTLIIAAVVAIVFLLKRAGQISFKDAQKHLKNGALVIDVRSASEFNSGHLPNAVNVPLDGIETALPRRVKDRNQVLLLHCLSGTRSGMAKRQLKVMGFANAYNLGSYARAQSILSGAVQN